MKEGKYANTPLLFIDQNIKTQPKAEMQYHYFTHDHDITEQLLENTRVESPQVEVLKKFNHLRSLMERLPKVICVITTADQEYRGKITKITDDLIVLQSGGQTRELILNEITDIQITSF